MTHAFACQSRCRPSSSAVSLVIHADVTPPSQAAEIKLQLGDLLFAEGRYLEALDAYRNALTRRTPDRRASRPRIGVIASALRVAEFDLARAEAEKLLRRSPRGPQAMALYGDALWSSGLFDEAEEQYQDALALSPELRARPCTAWPSRWPRAASSRRR